jgi:hypothetical protein
MSAFGASIYRGSIYSEASEEALRARSLLKDWAGEGFLTAEQYKQMEQETVCELRRTNIFLRIVLFLFTLIIVSAALGLFFVVFLQHADIQSTGVFLLIAGAGSYAVAELAVSQARLYRYGIEEALAACSIGFLCTGMFAAFFSVEPFSSQANRAEFLVPAAGVILSLWIWHRFGLSYIFLSAMIFAVWLSDYWTWSDMAHRLLIVAMYAVGLVAVAAIRPRYRFTYLDTKYSIAEALLWLGIYLAINLQLWFGAETWLYLTMRGWGGAWSTAEVSTPFYWTTWALIWCLPPVILTRGLRQKDRFVIAVGAFVFILTLATNKPYLGWQRHTWDPMLLGVVLMGIALFIRRWLAKGPDEIRHGFTAQRLSGKDKRLMSVGVSAFGLVSPNMITPSPQPASPDVHFGGGDSGGGGATSGF